MATERWARLREDLNCGLRRGAWYRVLNADRDTVILSVHRQNTLVSRDVLQFITDRPAKWMMVVHGRNSVSFPGRWGKRYAVCPSCCHRQMTRNNPRMMRCDKCNGLFEVGWDNPFNVGMTDSECENLGQKH